jgi:FkbM family methyltransferase
LASVLQEFRYRDIFLKIDIEGAEYRTLEDILAHEDRITGAAIEFHDIDLNRDRISRFFSSLKSLRITNVHANNFGGADANGDPLVIEVTLARAMFCRGEPSNGERSELETPNNPDIPDIELRYEGAPPHPAPMSDSNALESYPVSSRAGSAGRQAADNPTGFARGLKQLAQRIALGALRGFAKVTMFGRGRGRRTIGYEVLRSQQSLVLCGGPPGETFLVNSRDHIIGRELFISGEFDFEKFLLAWDLIATHRAETKPKLLIDVGCNIGTICIPAVARNYVEQAIAIEPDPENCRLLRANLELNAVAPQIALHCVAAGSADGEMLELELSPFNLGDHRIRTLRSDEHAVDSGRKSVVVSSAKLDTICSGQLDADFIVWMDVQGFEGHVLAGSSETLRRRPPLVLEFWPGALSRTGGFELLKGSLAAYSNFIDLAAPLRVRTVAELDLLFNEIGLGTAQTDILVF